MALTKIGTDGVKDDAITSGKIPANAVGSSELANNSVQGGHITSSAINDANVHPSAAIAGSKLADNSISLAKLEHGTSSNNGKFLRANNGADPTFETVNTDLVSDTSPQLGGTLDCNGQDVQFKSGGGNVKILYDASEDRLEFADGVKAGFGGANDLQIYHSGSHSFIDNEVGSLKIRDTGGVDKITVNGYGTTLSNTTDNAAMNDCLLLTRRGYEASGYGTKVQAMGGSATSQNGIQFAHSHSNGAGYTVRQRFDHDGIKFNGDTATANALDDYEEGTWDCSFQTNSGSFPSQSAVGRYTKIGRTVHIQGQVFWGASNGSGSGIIWMTLPFQNTSAARGGFSPGLVSGLDFDSEHQLYVMPEINSYNMYWMQSKPNDPAGGHAHLTPSAFRNYASRAISFAGTYMV